MLITDLVPTSSGRIRPRRRPGRLAPAVEPLEPRAMPSPVVAGPAARGAHARSPAGVVVTPTVPRTVTIPLTKVRVGDGIRLGIKVALAGGPPRLYLFDTGSTGMFVADGQISPAAYKKTGETFNQTYTRCQEPLMFFWK
jgi:hypothetical protein